MLKAVVNRFGSVYSFSGSYRADTWTLNINRDNTSIVPPAHTILTGIDATYNSDSFDCRITTHVDK